MMGQDEAKTPHGEPERLDLERFRTAWWQRLLREPASYEIARFAVLRLLAFVYLVAFASLAAQLEPLLGARGLLPAARFLEHAHAQLGSDAYWRVPTLFWLGCSDGAMRALCLAGLVLSAAALAGVTHGAVQLALWALYASFVHVGQIFYGYGWELQLLETGMITVFLAPWPVTPPWRGAGPVPQRRVPPVPMWLLRWLVFRVMLGAGLIKLRGDPCWRELTCLDTHFETQPNPNPLSFWFHHAPHAVHVAGVLFTHLAEVVAPWFVFAFRPARRAAGAVIVAFQLTLIASGNYSFFNWVTIVPALACFDDALLARALPQRARAWVLARIEALVPAGAVHRGVTIAYGLLVAVLSIAPIVNLASPRQDMNTNYDPLALVNTYGAFGSIDRERYELILEGTADDLPGPGSTWREYALPCMPGDPARRPCLVSPYQHRLDWQMWFAGIYAHRGATIGQQPWLVHLVWQLLRGEPGPKRLLESDPFPGAPPRAIRVGIWRYVFAPLGAREYWTRWRVGEFLPPVTMSEPALRSYVREYDWPDAPDE
jgi:hypothetical protein